MYLCARVALRFTRHLQVYCLDSQFVAEMPKFVAGTLSALSAMVQLELPHINVLTKVDLIKNKVGGGSGGVSRGRLRRVWRAFACGVS